MPVLSSDYPHLSAASGGPDHPAMRVSALYIFFKTESLHQFWLLVTSLSPSGLSSPRHGLCRRSLGTYLRTPSSSLTFPTPILDLGQSLWTIFLEHVLRVRLSSRCSLCVNSSNPPRWLTRENIFCYCFVGEAPKHWEFIFLAFRFLGVTDSSWSWPLISTRHLLGCLLVTHT